ncbi:hypothetical protein HG535_0E04400 [Zygotorulaspora mrakii]|uniref:Protein BOI2 n=1 Tax=Zygotorulaspora mrakii TaxID=42260 RepID=A0A7H9B4Q4_ZYGMR|nr:uncharacterized protein HG535_0E04400 [Zygotorulaspora mrakii]QLG73356.1 hypothetical protein HG535_0E04400 [Zygotorulaspora mrakii]
MSTRKFPVLSQLDTKSTSISNDTIPNRTFSSSQCGSSMNAVYIAINEYSKRMEDELDMKPGDKIQVITDDEEYHDGWYYGRNLRTKEEGLYPVVFTQEISPDTRPSVMRAKSSKRVASSGNGSNSNLSSFSQTGSTSELPTPTPLETASQIPLSLRKSFIDRKASLKTTMSDIDRALEELRTDSIGSRENMTQNLTHETILSSTRDLDISDPATASSTKSNDTTSLGLNVAANSINGISKDKLEPSKVNAWTPEEVTAFFIMSGFDIQSASRFQQHKVSGSILLQLELAHLKELDIDSFGTRFEIHKEIELLKEASDSVNMDETSKVDNSTQLMPPAFLNQNPSYRGHLRKVSQSLDDLPQKSPSNPLLERPSNVKVAQQRPFSIIDKFSEHNGMNSNNGTNSYSNNQMQNNHNNLNYNNYATPELGTPKAIITPQELKENVDPSLFTSPRRAPKPPSYPSPMQPPKSPSFSKDQNTWSGRTYSPPTIYEKAMSTSSEVPDPFKFPPPQSPHLQDYKVETGTPLAENSGMLFPSLNSDSGNRSSVIYSGHRKNRSGGSFVDLFNRVSQLSPGTQLQADELSGMNNNVDFNARPSSSIYVGHSRTASVARVRHPSQNSELKKHRRTSSMLSFFSAKNEDRPSSPIKGSQNFGHAGSHSRKNSYTVSPIKQQQNQDIIAPFSPSAKPPKISPDSSVPSRVGSSSPMKQRTSKKEETKRRSVSAKETSKDSLDDSNSTPAEDDKKKRSVSEAIKGKGTRVKTTRKQQTSAFMEGIRNVSVKDAMINADCSGWMSKKGSGAMGVWKTRFFTLHGTRLSYFASTTDSRERGLIDITAHCVIPAKEDDKLVSLYAASTGKGRYCFKLLPPAPGSKKGLTFTQPRVHYFAVDSKDDMRAWMAALIKTTIDIDTSVPIISSCATPTVSLSRAQEMLSEAREATRLREQQRYLNEEDEDQMLWESQQRQTSAGDDDMLGSAINISSNGNTTVNSTGFASPYLLASGALSPSIAMNGEKFQDRVKNNDYVGIKMASPGQPL